MPNNPDNPYLHTIATPAQAKVISQLPHAPIDQRKSLLAPVVSPEAGLEVYDLKKLVHQELPPTLPSADRLPFMQYYQSPLAPDKALERGLVLLNGAIYRKADFSHWQESLEAGWLSEVDATHLQSRDFIQHFIRSNLHAIGQPQLDSAPNLTWGLDSARGVFAWCYGEGMRLDPNEPDTLWSGEDHPIFTYFRSAYFDASKAHPAYGRRSEVAPHHINLYPYLYLGAYIGSPISPKSYLLLDEQGNLSSESITLAGDIGFNAHYMRA
ncbi:hypothetical protein PVA45_07755 (plasmid) [Entomospira entomophila]|uniref:Uncharacterized protein n=1 Tax=Entomospira entomophila TaxID=2719988 RepID=A0A968KS35_9SPIO|nr:hypothetical protein [Entomospira entomophilus]NIZ41398.1 hypothetical protein [Entomospira entomophilus]WDI36348.1 hypothetical protein PVA45_07755 [Entomospira entomophilus]